MPQRFAMPQASQYSIRADLPVYRVQAVHANKRVNRPKDVLFMLHDTDGRDSRQELYDSSRKVSVHYLIGEYPNTNGPVVIKYMSEFSEYANGAGFGSIGGFPNGINPVAVQFEIEYVNMNERTLTAYVDTIAQSMRIWRDVGSNVILLPHYAVDTRKSDPRFDWNAVCREIYERSHEL